MTGATGSEAPRPLDRRARRHQETIEEILDIAQDVMADAGVNGLSLAEVARRLGVQPPSIYKYFPSLMAVYDAIFLRGQLEHLAMRIAERVECFPHLQTDNEHVDLAVVGRRRRRRLWSG